MRNDDLNIVRRSASHAFPDAPRPLGDAEPLALHPHAGVGAIVVDISVPVTRRFRLHTQKALLQISTQKLLQALAFRIVKHLVRVAGFFDLALVQEHHLARNLARKTHLVCHQNHGSAFLGQALNDLQHFTDQFRVQ
ncbi:hypothetical protein ALP17_200012, partial [Pseudomonas savastanoi]